MVSIYTGAGQKYYIGGRKVNDTWIGILGLTWFLGIIVLEATYLAYKYDNQRRKKNGENRGL